MQVIRLPRALGALAATGALVTACTIGETRHETVTMARVAAAERKTCGSSFAKPDLSKLEACGEGRGHCYDGKRTALTGLPACKGDGRTCVPDPVLRAAGGKLKACTFFIGGKPGACMSLLIEDIEKHKDELKRDVCDESERCAPCVNPIDGTDTGVCGAVGVYDGDCASGAADAPVRCCHGAGVCMTKDGVPEDSRDDMQRDSCPGEKVCAPASLVGGAPVKCDVAGASGVCLDVCFAAQLRSTMPLLRTSCGPTEVCLPCFIGGPRGMPGCE